MKLNVRVIANAKRDEILKDGETFKAYLNAPAVEGKANKTLVRVLADYFSVKKSQINIIKGEKSRNKIVEVYDK